MERIPPSSLPNGEKKKKKKKKTMQVTEVGLLLVEDRMNMAERSDFLVAIPTRADSVLPEEEEEEEETEQGGGGGDDDDDDDDDENIPSLYFATGKEFYDDDYNSCDDQSIVDTLDFQATKRLHFASRDTILNELHRLYKQIYQNSILQQEQERKIQQEEEERRKQKGEQHAKQGLVVELLNEKEQQQEQEEQDLQDHQDDTVIQLKGKDDDSVTAEQQQPSNKKKKPRSRSPKKTERRKRHHLKKGTDDATTVGKSMVMIRGRSGTGKSTLVQQFYQQLTGGRTPPPTSDGEEQEEQAEDETPQQSRCSSSSSCSTAADASSAYTADTASPNKPYFLTGKYNERSAQNDPLSAIVDAFQEFLLHLQEDPKERQRIKTLILTQVLDDDEDDPMDCDDDDDDNEETEKVSGHILTAVLPALRSLLYGTTSSEKRTSSMEFTATTAGMSTTSPSQHPSTIQEDGPEQTSTSPRRKRSPSPHSPGITTSDNALNQLKYVFAKLCHAIATRDRPMILFLDDLQWCDATSLEVLETLLQEPPKYFFFIGAYRQQQQQLEEEYNSMGDHQSLLSSLAPSGHHCGLMDTAVSDWLAQFEPRTVTLDVPNLSLSELTQFVAAALHTKDDLQQLQEELVSVIYRKTMGNIFFSKHILEQLHRQHLLEFSRLTFTWEWQLPDDLDQVLSDTVLQAVTAKLQALPPALQHVLTVAAYTNKPSFDLETVYALLRYHDKLTTTDDRDSYDSSKPEWTLQVLVKLLDEAVLQGLLANSTGSTNYGFEHDRIQQAAFGLVSSGQERDRFRLNMGLGLLALATKGGILRLEQLANTKEWMLFTAADHLNASSFLYRMMRDHASAVIIKSHDGGDILTHLNCHVGYLAANKAAYETASKYLNLAAQELMHINKDPWDSQYEMTLKIYTKMVEVELWQGHFEKGRATAEQILTKSRTPPDRLPTQLALAKAFGREENHIEALRMAITALKSLKVYPVCKYGCLVRNLLYVKRYFRRKRDDEILSLPLMTDERCLMAMEFLSVASYQAYYVGNLPDFLVMMLLMLRKTFVLGLCGQSAVAFIGYALLCNNLNDMEGAHRFSTLSRQVLNRTKAKHLEAIQMLVVAHWITGWRDPHPQVLTVFERGYRSGMETGDFENALLCMSSGYHHEYAAGYPLPVLDTKYAQLAERLRMYKIDAIAVMVREQWRKIQHLMGRSPGGNPMDVNELGKFGPERGNDGSEKYRLLYGYLCRLELAFYFGSLEFAKDMAIKTRQVDSDKSFSTNSLRLYFTGLTYASLARSTKRRKCRRKARRCYKELKSLCDIKGLNSWHRCMVLEAHLKSMGGKEESRIESTYDRAVQCALSSGHIQDAALACQLAGEYFHSLNVDSVKTSIVFKAREHLAMRYLHRARGYYVQWGATCLARHLETRYPTYLSPMPRFSDATSIAMSYFDSETKMSQSRSNLMSSSSNTSAGVFVGHSHNHASFSVDPGAMSGGGGGGSGEFPSPSPLEQHISNSLTSQQLLQQNEEISVMTDPWKDSAYQQME